MLIIRGVNIYPSQIGSVLGRVPEPPTSARGSPTPLDEVEVLAEPRVELLSSLTDELAREVTERAERLVRDTIGCTMAVTLVGPGDAPRSDGGKIQRVTDLRSKATTSPLRGRLAATQGVLIAPGTTLLLRRSGLGGGRRPQCRASTSWGRRGWRWSWLGQAWTIPSGKGDSFSAPAAEIRKLSSTRSPPPPST